MKTLTMRTILGTVFAMVSLLPTLPAHATTGNIAVQPNDPIALAFQRTLEGFVDPATNGQPDDLMVGENIGGVNVSGGTVGLYATGGMPLGALGVSGDTSYTDHVIPWRLRKALGFGQVPAGVHPPARWQ